MPCTQQTVTSSELTTIRQNRSGNRFFLAFTWWVLIRFVRTVLKIIYKALVMKNCLIKVRDVNADREPPFPFFKFLFSCMRLCVCACLFILFISPFLLSLSLSLSHGLFKFVTFFYFIFILILLILLKKRGFKILKIQKKRIRKKNTKSAQKEK